MSVLLDDINVNNPYIDIPFVRKENANGRPWIGASANGKNIVFSNDNSSAIDQLSYLAGGATAPQARPPHVIILVNGQHQKVVIRKPADVKDTHREGPSASEFAGQIELIKEKFGLSVTQLAELFGVTRKSIYDWYEGATPRADKVNKALRLAAIISEEKFLDVKRLKTVWNIEGESGSFLKIFQSDEIADKDLHLALTKKLNELSHFMVPSSELATRRQKPNSGIGHSHLAEFDRRADFS